MLSFATLALTMALSAPPEKTVEVEALQRLSGAWSRAAMQMISEPEVPAPENYEGAVVISRMAAELQPNDAEGWRSLLEIADATDEGMLSSATAANEAVLRMSKLAPGNLVLRLARLDEVVNRSTTAEERITAYEHLLQPASIDKISRQVASRLAFDYSLLLRRRGDADAAMIRLRESVKLDRWFPSATSQVAAYELEADSSLEIRSNALVDAILANPTEISHFKELGHICMGQGMYEQADILFGIASRIASRNLMSNEFESLLIQQMLARWGMGKHQKADNIFQARKQEILEITKEKINSGLAAQPVTALTPAMNTIHAVMCKSGSLPNAQEALDEAISGLDMQIEAMKDNPSRRILLLMEKTWVSIGVGSNLESAQPWIDEIQSSPLLSEKAKAKLNGWMKLRAGMTDQAIEILKPLASSDPGARLGYALALSKAGNVKDAAQEFATIVRADPAHALGLYANDQLFQIVNKRLGSSSQASEIMKAFERLPPGMFQFSKDESPFIKVSAEFLSTTAKPFESMPCKIEIINKCPMTLTISTDGPIESRAAIILEVISGANVPKILPPIIILIDEQIEIAPNEKLSFVIDISRLPAAAELLKTPLDGAYLQVELVTNFRLTLDAVVPGFLGRTTDKKSLRISPVVCNAAWRDESLGSIFHCDKPDDLATLVLLAFDLASRSGDVSAQDEVKEGWAEVAKAWKQLPAAAQAWTLMVLPKEPASMISPIVKAAKESQDVRVQTSALLRWVDSEDDPFLSALERGGNQQLITIASSIRAKIADQLRGAAQLTESKDEFGVLGGDAKVKDATTPGAAKKPGKP